MRLLRKKSISQLSSPGRYVPQRTCVACRRVKAKRELVRLVRAGDGSIEIDAGGKKSGRGVYLCPLRDCWEVGLKGGGRLEYALRTRLTTENRERLSGYGKSLGEEK